MNIYKAEIIVISYSTLGSELFVFIDGMRIHTMNVKLTFEISMRLLRYFTTRHTAALTAIHCNTLQYTAIHCNTLQHTATHCNTLQHTSDTIYH